VNDNPLMRVVNSGIPILRDRQQASRPDPESNMEPLMAMGTPDDVAPKSA